MKRFWLILLCMLVTVGTAAQVTTRVRGVVKDAETGEPIPFAGVYFDGTSIGISTDLEGRYSLETRSQDIRLLTAQIIGYESLSVPVSKGVFSEVNFTLRPDRRQLNAALVKPDNRYIKSILRKLSESLEVNDPDNAPDWSSRLYSKIELDVTNMEDLLSVGVLEKNLGFLLQYADTSAITGKAFIPAMLSENISDIYHSQNPPFQREVIRYNHMSGLGIEEEDVLRQYSGSHLLRADFFKHNITVLNLDIPNPAASSSQLFYNYFLVDSLQVEGRKTYVLRFHPKKLVTSPTFDGEMQIDAQDFGIRSVHAALSRNSNVNWVRHINVDVQNRRTPDGRWFYDDERLFLDLSVFTSDSSRMVSFIGRRQLSFQEPEYGPVQDRDALTSKNVVVERNVQSGDPELWEQLRPFPLTPREQGIFEMVEEFEQSKFYKRSYALLRTLISGYFRIPGTGFELGRWARTVVYNQTEGLRLQLGGRTWKEFSEFIRLGGYVAYGFRDKQFKWQASAEMMFGLERTRKLTLQYKDDFVQFGGGSVLTVQNMFTSLAARNHLNRQSRVRAADILYEHEFSPSVNASLDWTSARVWGNPLVPFQRPDGSFQDSYASHTLHATLRFSKDERVTRNTFKKTYVFTKYPILYLDVMGGIKGISKDDFSYLRTSATLLWKTPSNAIGYGNLQLEGGAIWGSIPYPLLKLHEGNQSFFLDRRAFSCMNYYEFISDRWLSGYYEHNFNGFFLGKIPLIKELDLREVATARFAWGTLSEANSKNAPFRLPQGSGTLETPYVELGVGISNIFRVVRVDAFWRVTHRLPEARQNFTINVGFDIDF